VGKTIKEIEQRKKTKYIWVFCEWDWCDK